MTPHTPSSIQVSLVSGEVDTYLATFPAANLHGIAWNCLMTERQTRRKPLCSAVRTAQGTACGKWAKYCTVTTVEFHHENLTEIYDHSVNLPCLEHKTRQNFNWEWGRCVWLHTVSTCVNPKAGTYILEKKKRISPSVNRTTFPRSTSPYGSHSVCCTSFPVQSVFYK